MKVIVIGLGSMGKRRIRLMQTLRSSDEIIGIDTDSSRCKEINERYSISCFTTIEKAISLNDIDCAFVCTSPLSHGNIIAQCLAAGWNVFSEINLVSDMYQENIALAKAKGLVLFLSSTPMYRQEMQLIQEKIKINNEAVNYIYHVGQYLPDWHPWENYNKFFVGNERTNGCREIMAIELPWMIQAFGDIVDINTIASKMSKLEIKYNDNYYIEFTHQNGTKGIFIVDVICRHAIRHLEVFSENLFLEWNGKPDSLFMKNLQTSKLEIVGTDDYSRQEGYSEFVNEISYLNEIESFFNVLHGEKQKYTFEEDEKILHIIDIIEKG